MKTFNIRQAYTEMEHAKSRAYQRFCWQIAEWVDDGTHRQADIARALGVSRQTVRKWTARGRS
jgi:transposase